MSAGLSQHTQLVLRASCSNCQARPGEPCTQPTNDGRREVAWTHIARIDRARQAVDELEERDPILGFAS